MKTTFGPGVIVTSKWLNGAREIYFDGQDLDWHFPPISIGDVQRGGTTGLDTAYVTVGTNQTFGGVPITGNKAFMGFVAFGDESNANPSNAPASWTTQAKFNQGGEDQNFTTKFANLSPQDLITKTVLDEQVNNFPIIDEGSF